MWQLVELCNKGYNSNLKNLLVKHQNSSVYWHRWRLLSGVSLICFYGIILEIFLAELYGWLTPDERAFARLYPWNHEVAIFLGRRRESEVIYKLRGGSKLTGAPFPMFFVWEFFKL